MKFTEEFIHRFRSRITKTQTCWLWTGSLDYKGYGAISLSGQMLKAHRVAFHLRYGRWPSPCGLHGCDTPRCVRVGKAHVHEGTCADNTAQMMRRSRNYTGEPRLGISNSAAKLTPRKVRSIRRLRKSRMALAAIGVLFGISQSQVHNVVAGRPWRHVR